MQSKPSSPIHMHSKSKVGLQQNGDQIIQGTPTSVHSSPLKQARNYKEEHLVSPMKQVDKSQILGRPIEIIRGNILAN